MMEWEYQKLGVIIGDCPDPAGTARDDGFSKLNRLGREGWEIDQAIPLIQGGGGPDCIIFVLRRELRTEWPLQRRQ